MEAKINIGTTPMDKTGDKLRTAFSKINCNVFEFKAVSTNTTLTDAEYIVICEDSVDITLPAAVDNINKKYLIKNLDPGLGFVKLIPDGTDLIDTVSTLDIDPGDKIHIISDGSKWIII